MVILKWLQTLPTYVTRCQRLVDFYALTFPSIELDIRHLPLIPTSNATFIFQPLSCTQTVEISKMNLKSYYLTDCKHIRYRMEQEAAFVEIKSKTP